MLGFLPSPHAGDCTTHIIASRMPALCWSSTWWKRLYLIERQDFVFGNGMKNVREGGCMEGVW